ncbi:7-methylguanosine phosphate-specific 5'-nucleotidase isoform X2 [Morus notabilis]|uniref:7-methylguanosine phosphate-specific 5'-nucleotidase isoform X2 n=1 Tax=Morus notabilis TaxID=981085 RepID=UPI000CED4AC7|nr:7-methylguanosine phosphate-specific 5'-nucleotidase isoform X2 [Morus notabilis]
MGQPRHQSPSGRHNKMPTQTSKKITKKKKKKRVKKHGHSKMSNQLQSFFKTVSVNLSSERIQLCFPTTQFCSSSRLWFSSGRFEDRFKMLGNGLSDGCEVVVADPQLLDDKISAIRTAGPTKLQVIADFDATLTRYWVNGRRGTSSHGLLRQGNPEYDKKRRDLYYHYHPLEFSPTIPIDEKTKLMEEWWGKTHALLIEGGLTCDAIKQSVADSIIAFREGVAELFELLEEKDIPILIFSAGLADIIEEVLRQKFHKSFKNVKIVSNRMVFNESGHLVAFKGKTIHSLNKNEHALEMAAPLHDQLGDVDGPTYDNSSVKTRTNVLLLGDHLGDLGMSDGLNYETRISVGFLNDNIENSLDNYRNAFDIVYLNDAPMSGVVKLVSQLWSSDGV